MSDTETQEYEAAFREAIGQTPAGESPQVEQVTEGPEQAAETQGQAADSPPEVLPTNPTDDIWANVAPELKAAFEAAETRARQAEHRAKSDEGRVSRFQRERDELRRQLGAIKGAAEHEDLEAYLASEEWTKVKTEYGDDLKPIFSALETLAARDKTFQARFGEMDEARAEAQANANAEWLDREVPDMEELFGRDEFTHWLETQPDGVRAMSDRNWDKLVDPAEVKVLADLFRASLPATAQPESQTQKIDPKRAAQLDAARSSKTRQPPIVADASEDDYEAAFKAASAKLAKDMAPLRR